MTSSLSGHLYRWESGGRRRSAEPPLSASHPDPINALVASGGSSWDVARLVVGNDGGGVRVFGSALEKLAEFSLADLEARRGPSLFFLRLFPMPK